MESNGHDLFDAAAPVAAGRGGLARGIRAKAQLSVRGRAQLRRGAPVGTPPGRTDPTTNLLTLLSYVTPNPTSCKWMGLVPNLREHKKIFFCENKQRIEHLSHHYVQRRGGCPARCISWYLWRACFHIVNLIKLLTHLYCTTKTIAFIL